MRYNEFVDEVDRSHVDVETWRKLYKVRMLVDQKKKTKKNEWE